MSAEKPTFREVVAEALRDDRYTHAELDALARALREGLKRAGYSIHRSGECVHPRTRASELGRPMTPDEERLLEGLLSGDPAT